MLNSQSTPPSPIKSASALDSPPLPEPGYIYPAAEQTGGSRSPCAGSSQTLAIDGNPFNDLEGPNSTLAKSFRQMKPGPIAKQIMNEKFGADASRGVLTLCDPVEDRGEGPSTPISRRPPQAHESEGGWESHQMDPNDHLYKHISSNSSNRRHSDEGPGSRPDSRAANTSRAQKSSHQSASSWDSNSFNYDAERTPSTSQSFGRRDAPGHSVKLPGIQEVLAGAGLQMPDPRPHMPTTGSDRDIRRRHSGSPRDSSEATLTPQWQQSFSPHSRGPISTNDNVRMQPLTISTSASTSTTRAAGDDASQSVDDPLSPTNLQPRRSMRYYGNFSYPPTVPSVHTRSLSDSPMQPLDPRASMGSNSAQAIAALGYSSTTAYSTLPSTSRFSNSLLPPPRPRVSVACQFCRSRKLRCSNPPGPCEHCSRRGKECVFEATPRGAAAATAGPSTNPEPTAPLERRRSSRGSHIGVPPIPLDRTDPRVSGLANQKSGPRHVAPGRYHPYHGPSTPSPTMGSPRSTDGPNRLAR